MCSTVSSPLEALARVTDLLAGACGQGDVPVDGESLAALRRCIDRLEAVFVGQLCRFEDAGGHRVDGARSATAWARESLRMNGGAARERLRAGRMLAKQLPAVGAAFAAGEVSPAHVAAIASFVEGDPARRAQLAQAEPELLQVARTVEPRRMRQVIEGWALDADPDADRRHAMQLYQQRTLMVAPTASGAVDVLGQLDPVGGAAVITALDAVASSLRSPKDERTASQLRADALVALATGALAFGEHAPGARIPDSGGLRPQVVVTIPLSAVRERLGAGELERVGRISADTALRIMCDAAVQPALIDDTTGEPLDLGRSQRDPDPRLRRAVLLRDRGCRFAGCDRPWAWCEIHHLTPWSHGGRTDRANLVVLCTRHHHDVHDGGFRILKRAGGGFRTLRPDGTEIQAAPPIWELRRTAALVRQGEGPPPHAA